MGDLSTHSTPENFPACRTDLPETDGSFFSDLAELPLCTGVIFAVVQSAGDTAPFKNRAETIGVRGSRRLGGSVEYHGGAFTS